jgi:hypothetical protein
LIFADIRSLTTFVPSIYAEWPHAQKCPCAIPASQLPCISSPATQERISEYYEKKIKYYVALIYSFKNI